MVEVLIVNCYDSFVYNLVQLVEESGAQYQVLRPSQITLETAASFDKILFSPGPGIPSEIPLLSQLLHAYGPTKSILGICLGMQAISESFLGEVRPMDQILHGEPSEVFLSPNANYLFRGIESSFRAARYHSWHVPAESLPDCLLPTCHTQDGLVMGLRHKHYDIQGLQFHPESILTKVGPQLIRNWIWS